LANQKGNRSNSYFLTMVKHSFVTVAILTLIVIVVVLQHVPLAEDRIRGVGEADIAKERILKKKKTTKPKMKAKGEMATKTKTTKKKNTKGNKGKGKGNTSKRSFFSKSSKTATLPTPETPTLPLAMQSPSRQESGPCSREDDTCLVLYSEDYESPQYNFSDASLNYFSAYGFCFSRGPEGEPNNAILHWHSDYANTVNLAYGRGSNLYDQDYTVEVVYIATYIDQASGQSLQVSDGRAGKYAIGMLTELDNDKVRLTFNVEGRSFVNFAIDIAPFATMNAGACDDGSVVFPTEPAKLTVSAMIDSSSTLLSTVTLTGSSGQPGFFSVVWERVCGSLDVSQAMGGNITIEWDALEPVYIFFDNVDIVASDDPNRFPPGC
jgi:hypothetical protein